MTLKGLHDRIQASTHEAMDRIPHAEFIESLVLIAKVLCLIGTDFVVSFFVNDPGASRQ